MDSSLFRKLGRFKPQAQRIIKAGLPAPDPQPVPGPEPAEPGPDLAGWIDSQVEQIGKNLLDPSTRKGHPILRNDREKVIERRRKKRAGDRARKKQQWEER